MDLVVKGGLQGIEWGGDVHVPHGNLERAREVGRMTRDAGLAIASYGSYYRVGHEEPAPFEAVLDTAAALKAPTIRVWAGNKGSADADKEYRESVVTESRRIGELAARVHIQVAYEYHGATLTDTAASTQKLLEEVGLPNVKSYWQPWGTVEECTAGLESVLPSLVHVHAYSWDQATGERLPLSGRVALWRRCLRMLRTTGRDHFVLLEFVRNDSPDAFLEDAETLARWRTGD